MLCQYCGEPIRLDDVNSRPTVGVAADVWWCDDPVEAQRYVSAGVCERCGNVSCEEIIIDYTTEGFSNYNDSTGGDE